MVGNKEKKIKYMNTRENAWVNQKFCNIFVCDSLRKVYHVTEAVLAVVGSYNGWFYLGIWCDDILYVASLYVEV